MTITLKWRSSGIRDNRHFVNDRYQNFVREFVDYPIQTPLKGSIPFFSIKLLGFGRSQKLSFLKKNRLLRTTISKEEKE